jgi:1,4-dihydroxy-2-naphthoyl-CoA hydrolase
MLDKESKLSQLNSLCKGTMIEHLGIEITEVGNQYLCGKMPVDHRTIQPLGLVHGGAFTALAETLGSFAGINEVDWEKQYCVGMEINANHLKSVKNGYVHGKATPIHIGRKTQVWEIRLTNDKDELVCISRMTLAVLDKTE